MVKDLLQQRLQLQLATDRLGHGASKSTRTWMTSRPGR